MQDRELTDAELEAVVGGKSQPQAKPPARPVALPTHLSALVKSAPPPAAPTCSNGRCG